MSKNASDCPFQEELCEQEDCELWLTEPGRCSIAHIALVLDRLERLARELIQRQRIAEGR